MKEYKDYTIKKTIKEYTLKITQHLRTEYNFGHYNYYIEDSDENVVHAGYSTGAPPDKIDKSFVNNLLNDFIRDRKGG